MADRRTRNSGTRDGKKNSHRAASSNGKPKNGKRKRKLSPSKNGRDKKVVQYKKSKNINLGMIIFAVAFIYIGISVFHYATAESISTYEVQYGSLTNENTFTGLILRSEAVINSSMSGYINYFAKEESKIAVGDAIFTVDETGEISTILQSEDRDTNNISNEELSALQSQMNKFSLSFNKSEFSSVYNFKYSLQSKVLESFSQDTITSISSLVGTTDNFQVYNSEYSGLLLYNVDGYEGLTAADVTSSRFDKQSYSKTELRGNEMIEVDTPAYKVITDETWSIIVPLTEAQISSFSDVKKVDIEFLDTGLCAVADFAIINNNGENYGQITLYKYMVNFSKDRFVDIEIKDSEKSGLKIPVTSLTTKDYYTIPKEYVTQGGNNNRLGFNKEVYLDDGSASVQFTEVDIVLETEEYYYVDPDDFETGDCIIKPDSSDRYQVGATAPATGVYNINKGYAVFKIVNILYQNDEYCIVDEDMSYSISLYDRIALDGSKLVENQVIY